DLRFDVWRFEFATPGTNRKKLSSFAARLFLLDDCVFGSFERVDACADAAGLRRLTAFFLGDRLWPPLVVPTGFLLISAQST
ncbi:MAG: hypothetical protein ACWA5L_01470, partial [bacterium]